MATIIRTDGMVNMDDLHDAFQLRPNTNFAMVYGLGNWRQFLFSTCACINGVSKSKLKPIPDFSVTRI